VVQQREEGDPAAGSRVADVRVASVGWPGVSVLGSSRSVPGCEFAESQNGGVGRDLWGSPGPTPLPKQGHLQQAAQDLVRAGLEFKSPRRGVLRNSHFGSQRG